MALLSISCGDLLKLESIEIDAAIKTFSLRSKCLLKILSLFWVATNPKAPLLSSATNPTPSAKYDH
jgi:hypothetical protein